MSTENFFFEFKKIDNLETDKQILDLIDKKKISDKFKEKKAYQEELSNPNDNKEIKMEEKPIVEENEDLDHENIIIRKRCKEYYDQNEKKLIEKYYLKFIAIKEKSINEYEIVANEDTFDELSNILDIEDYEDFLFVV
jgi:hypothetical protein